MKSFYHGRILNSPGALMPAWFQREEEGARAGKENSKFRFRWFQGRLLGSAQPEPLSQ